MCKEAAQERLCLLESILDWSMIQQQTIKIWHDNNDYCYDYGVEWYDEYKKLKARKASIKEELMPIAWHPSRWWDWCVPEHQERETEKKFFDYLIC